MENVDLVILGSEVRLVFGIIKMKPTRDLADLHARVAQASAHTCARYHGNDEK